MKVLEQVAENILVVECSLCDATGRFNPDNPMSPDCTTCEGRGRFLVRIVNGVFDPCNRCDGSGRFNPANRLSVACQRCGGIGGLTEGGPPEILDWSELDHFRSRSPSGFMVMMFTDIQGSTELTQRLGDEKAQELVRSHNSIVRAALREHRGIEHKHTGDGIMAYFRSTTDALACAIAIQKSRAADPTLRRRLHLSIGLSAGEPQIDEHDAFGTVVQLAKRLCELAGRNQILAAEVVKLLTDGKGFRLTDLGDLEPKGFKQPVRGYEVKWRKS